MVKPFKFYFPNKNMAASHFLVTDRYIKPKYFGFVCYFIQGVSTVLYVLHNLDEKIDLIVFNVYMMLVFIAILVSS